MNEALSEWLLIGVDVLLISMLLVLAWLTCNTQHLQRGITLFVAFGLLLAVIWARLKAPDLALAEAAIGAGISGALLLKAMRDYPTSSAPTKPVSWQVVWGINLLSLVLFVVLAWALWHALLRSDGIRLAEQALTQTASSGVSHPVTAVLLNFRAYDTLLELAVVLTAVLTVLALAPKRRFEASADGLLPSMLHWLVPILVVTSGYLLWVGAYEPGGAFQAGAVLAAAFILLQMNGYNVDGIGVTSLRWLLVIGIAVFAVMGLGMMIMHQGFLTYPEAWAGTLILLIESAATLSIATALTLAYLGGRPDAWDQSVLPKNTIKTEE